MDVLIYAAISPVIACMHIGGRMATHLYLIRHGDYIFDVADGKYSDQGLSVVGIQQAERLRDRLLGSELIKADVVIASTMLRARQTAEILAPAFGVPVVYDTEIEEWRN